MRDLRVADIRLVGGVVEDDGALLAGVGHPLRQRLLGDDGARRVVRVAQVDEIDRPIRQRRAEAVLGGTRQVDEAVVAAGALVQGAGAPGHHVAVDVDRIDRVGEGHHTVGGKQLLDIGGVALGAVTDEHILARKRHATGAKSCVTICSARKS